MNEARPRWKQVVDSWNQGFADLARNIGKAFQRCGEINGEECAASFAYYAFFSLFPLILLMAAIGTFFIPDRYQAARQVVQEVEQYVPLQAKDRELLFTIMDDAIKNGWRAWDFWALGAALGRSTLFSGAGNRHEQGVGRQKLRMVETAAKEPSDARDSGQRARSRTCCAPDF